MQIITDKYHSRTCRVLFVFPPHGRQLLHKNKEAFKATAPSIHLVFLKTPAWQCKNGTQIINEKNQQSLINNRSCDARSAGRVALWRAGSGTFYG